jgi:hypothetical protein
MAKTRPKTPRAPKPKGLLVLNQKAQVFADRRKKRARHPKRDQQTDPGERADRSPGSLSSAVAKSHVAQAGMQAIA